MTLRLGRILLPATYLLGLLAAVLVVVGSTRAWARTWGEGFFGEPIEVNYANGINGDGQVTLAIGILAIAMILWRLLRPRSSTFLLAATIVVFVIAGLVGVFNWSEVRQIAEVYRDAKYFRFGYDIGWGLVLVTVAGFTGAGALAYQMWNDHFR